MQLVKIERLADGAKDSLTPIYGIPSANREKNSLNHIKNKKKEEPTNDHLSFPVKRLIYLQQAPKEEKNSLPHKIRIPLAGCHNLKASEKVDKKLPKIYPQKFTQTRRFIKRLKPTTDEE